jgi:hypothetical protein
MQPKQTTQFKLFPNRPRDFCIKAQIHGQCNANCRFQHVRITNNKAKKALKELKPIIANPKKNSQFIFKITFVTHMFENFV